MEEEILIASDHAGYPLKEIVKKHLKELNHKYVDLGCNDLNSVSYVSFAKKLSKKISLQEYKKGILICGTGIGMSITANREKNVRAALCNDIFSAKMSRLHNNSNILCIGARIIGDKLAIEIVNTWLETKFEEGRHQKRLEEIENDIEQN